MNMADRIQQLRKTKGISQEELADKIGVSRQAVSKWESEQSSPDLEKVIIMSDFFEVTTDYILKGIEPTADKDKEDKSFTSKKLYYISTLFIFIGLFCAFGWWGAVQTMTGVWASMCIQAIGVACYFIAKAKSEEKASFYLNWINIAGAAFIPVYMLMGFLSDLILTYLWRKPYPSGVFHVPAFLIVYLMALVSSYVILRKRTKLS